MVSIDLGHWYGMICLTAGFLSTVVAYFWVGPEIGASDYILIVGVFILGTLLANYALAWSLYALGALDEPEPNEETR